MPIKVTPTIELLNEAAEELAVRAGFAVLTESAVLSAAATFAARIRSVAVVARSHDRTLFATSTRGLVHNQALYYPANSEQVFGACDCLRFRNTKQRICEHLALIAVNEIFGSAAIGSGRAA